jgi:hypothetical protein
MPRYIRSQIQERSARRRFVADVLAKAGIRTGSIVRCLQDGHLYVVVKPMTHRLHMRRLENNWTKSVGTPHPDSPDASMGVELVCNPPDGWIHPFAVQPRTVRGPGCDFTAACRDLRKYVNERLAENVGRGAARQGL